MAATEDAKCDPFLDTPMDVLHSFNLGPPKHLGKEMSGLILNASPMARRMFSALWQELPFYVLTDKMSEDTALRHVGAMNGRDFRTYVVVRSWLLNIFALCCWNDEC